MARIYPYLFCNDAIEQGPFYEKALGGLIIDLRTFEEAPQVSEEIKERIMHWY
ncbi:hypothetical protein GLW08_02220 [Pontibacillus yanchengensis]|uniref:Uncharacterized protein n=2 Tax=Pontibacillus yanchengensis TaxID=462910 RepID=A0ACC7VDY2_9BACI|nr:hypothetical protein [Pontibacillus yanchengensis]MYL33001.1 hypothetical protein [Pontibacillus yanchengensis]MYL52149.1 hypothetical protein [Pontibacillus yanchengensis]